VVCVLSALGRKEPPDIAGCFRGSRTIRGRSTAGRRAIRIAVQQMGAAGTVECTGMRSNSMKCEIDAACGATLR
jgi:hypothetical protein